MPLHLYLPPLSLIHTGLMCLCTCLFICACTCTHSYMPVCTSMYLCLYTPIFICLHSCSFMHACLCAHLSVFVLVCSPWICMHPRPPHLSMPAVALVYPCCPCPYMPCVHAPSFSLACICPLLPMEFHCAPTPALFVHATLVHTCHVYTHPPSRWPVFTLCLASACGTSL